MQVHFFLFFVPVTCHGMTWPDRVVSPYLCSLSTFSPMQEKKCDGPIVDRTVHSSNISFKKEMCEKNAREKKRVSLFFLYPDIFSHCSKVKVSCGENDSNDGKRASDGEKESRMRG